MIIFIYILRYEDRIRNKKLLENMISINLRNELQYALFSNDIMNFELFKYLDIFYIQKLCSLCLNTLGGPGDIICNPGDCINGMYIIFRNKEIKLIYMNRNFI